MPIFWFLRELKNNNLPIEEIQVSDSLKESDMYVGTKSNAYPTVGIREKEDLLLTD